MRDVSTERRDVAENSPDSTASKGAEPESASLPWLPTSPARLPPANENSSDKTLSTEPSLLVAFIGDQGNNEESDKVLRLIRKEGAHATIHNGDFDYAHKPEAWEARINSILGENYPYFAIIGNHDAPRWKGAGGYAERIAKRHARVSEMRCQGELGVKASCNFRGLQIIESCIGVSELRKECTKDSPSQLKFIENSLRSSTSLWTICAWHKNQRDMQVGAKTDEVGWLAYQSCMRHGAIITTGHEHSYSRSLTLKDLGNRRSAHGQGGNFDLMELSAGSTFVVVSGLAGFGIRPYLPALHDKDTWWASYFASNAWLKNGIKQKGLPAYGALFMEFNVKGDERLARGYFKAVDGRIIDEFTVRLRQTAR